MGCCQKSTGQKKAIFHEILGFLGFLCSLPPNQSIDFMDAMPDPLYAQVYLDKVRDFLSKAPHDFVKASPGKLGKCPNRDRKRWYIHGIVTYWNTIGKQLENHRKMVVECDFMGVTLW